MSVHRHAASATRFLGNIERKSGRWPLLVAGLLALLLIPSAQRAIIAALASERWSIEFRG
jgi:hypothetical protein